MENSNSLNRFITAQKDQYAIAFGEIQAGRKRSHWMWFIFPQVKGLGMSELSSFYGITGLPEAEEYLNHPVLGRRLRAICQELEKLPTNDAHEIFGSPDDLKLKSCLTLFAAVTNPDPVFESLLRKFYQGKRDNRTLALINNQ